MNNDTTQEKIEALAAYLKIDAADITEGRNDHYGLTTFEADGNEYAVGTDDEATAAAVENIRQSAWTFNASFILSQCNLPSALEDAVKAWQEKECEGCNEDIVDMIERHCPGGIEGPHSFSEDAIRADGRGHFMNSYDGEEIELSYDGKAAQFFAYRIN